MVDFGVHNFFISEILMQIVDVLGMKISPFESRKQEKYISPKLTSFQIMKCVPI